jgi:hypothetical protein
MGLGRAAVESGLTFVRLFKYYSTCGSIRFLFSVGRQAAVSGAISCLGLLEQCSCMHKLRAPSGRHFGFRFWCLPATAG